MSAKTEDENQKKPKEGGKTALIVCAVVIIILLAVILFLLLRKDEDEESKRNIVVTPDNVQDVIQDLEEKDVVGAGSYEVTMNTTWNFRDGASASDNAYVENSVSNTHDVYFDITLADTGENIYSSPVLPLGSHIENITLDKDLDAGTYDCVVTYTLVDEDQNPLSTVRVSLAIVIES